MPGLEDLYREIILDHYRTPRNRGELPPPAAHAVGHNPLCGDEIDVYLQVDDDIVTDVKVGGQGCSHLAELGIDDEPGRQGQVGRRGARPGAPLQGDDVDRGQSPDGEQVADVESSSATSRRCRASSSSRCGSSAPPWPGTRCSRRSAERHRRHDSGVRCASRLTPTASIPPMN